MNKLLYHLNAYTYADPTWFPDMDPELRAMFARVTKGALSGNAGEAAKEDCKVNGEYVDTPENDSSAFLYRQLRRESALEFPDEAARTSLLHQRQFHEGAPAEHARTRV